MVSSSDLILVIADRLKAHKARNIVVDPVMVATSGSALMKTDAVQTLINELLPLSTIVTPNIPEAQVLSGLTISGKDDMILAAKKTSEDCHCAVLLKGGHSINDANDLLQKALIDAGFGDRLAKMEKGLDTMLYKELSEEGVDVSGGEAQKIAIARALYENAPCIILDEPTAALDPIAEAEIYGKFDEIAGDKTAIYISHRLSSCKFCDEIAVFHEGAVIQQGSHASLVADTDGKYYELWNAQAQYYTKNQTA